ncbi:hypothetical protein EOL96_05430 [Candidatus Saccharibacteria bacterium]|nr:hypothetical protein [Candidatus Saccharibacteria bacterium]
MWKPRRLFFMAAGVCIAVVSAQLLFPYDVAVPFARMSGENVGFTPRNQLAAQSQTAFEQSTVSVQAGDRTATRKLPSLGAELNSDRMSEKLTRYPLWERFVPLSIFVKWPQVDKLDVTLAGVRVEEAAADLAKELSYAPTDAGLTIKEDNLEVVLAEEGRLVAVQNIRDALLHGVYSEGTTVLSVSSQTISPSRSDADVATAKEQAKNVLSYGMTIEVSGIGTYSPDVATRAKWISIALDVTPAALIVNKEAVQVYVRDVNNSVSVAPKDTIVTLTDGKETDRQEGVPGRAIDENAVVSSISQQLLELSPDKKVTTELYEIVPSVRKNRTYSNTQEGLRAYVAYATSTQNVRIVVQQLNGEGWSASGRANESLPSASTYKLYVAKMLFKKMEEGTIHWDDPMLDTTVSGCFDRMTIASTNPCAVEWLAQFDRGAVNNYLYSLGFSGGTSFTHPEAVHTTASDLAKFMIGLENGTLVSGAYRERLYSSLSSHSYRNGIPTGVKGSVYDKVGFLWDYVHDSSIVYGPKGTYVLVIMTKGYSYAYIANVARQIESIMYP